MKKIALLIVILSIAFTTVEAQVGINNANPDSTAVLDLKSTSKGLLIPRMTSSERDIMSSFGNVPANSLLVFDTDLRQFCFWNAPKSQWDVINNWKSPAGNGSNIYIDDTVCVGIGSSIIDAQLDLAGSINKGQNINGKKLWIRSYDSDGSQVYIIKAEDENGGVDFYILNKPSSSGRATMYFAGNFGIGTQNPSERLEINGNVKATEFIGNGAIPVGGIIMWSGSTSSIPAGWALCNGLTVNGHATPDLRGRFIIGAGSTYAVGNTGGSERVTLTTNEMPSHNHGITDPGHTHGFWSASNYVHNLETDPNTSTDNVRQNSSNFSTTNSTTGITINNNGGGQSHENRPPYYALAYIMRVQ